MKVIKSLVMNENNKMTNQCRDMKSDCSFLKHNQFESKCNLFNVNLSNDMPLVICDKVYGMTYSGKV